MYIYAKALHVISVISWFAGLVYLGRIFIYHREASDKSELESNILIPQFKIMEKRVLNYICFPAMYLSFAFGLYMLFYAKIYYQTWFHLKFLFIVLLAAYHYYALSIYKRLTLNSKAFSSIFLRVFNELLTLLLVGIVFITITKNVKVSLLVLLFITILLMFMLYRLNRRKI